MKEIWQRLLVKLTSQKAIFAAAVLVILCTVNLSPTNANVLTNLIYAVLGAKAAQYAADAIKMKRSGPNAD